MPKMTTRPAAEDNSRAARLVLGFLEGDGLAVETAVADARDGMGVMRLLLATGEFAARFAETADPQAADAFRAFLLEQAASDDDH